MDDFAMLFKQLRKKTGLNQTEFGKRIGVSAAAVSEYETGKSRPGQDKLSLISKEFNISIDELLGNRNDVSGEVVTGNIRSVSTNIGQFIHALPLISVKGRASVIEHSLEGCQLHFIEDTYPVYLPEGVDKNDYSVLEIEGDSMEPEIRDRAKVLAVMVKRADFEYESGGVYAVLFANRFVIKRIKTNDLALVGQLVLHSDNERYGTITVKAEDLRCIWKIVKIVDQPVR